MSTASAKSVRPAQNKRRGRGRRVVSAILGVVVALIWIFPVYWMVNSAFLPNSTLLSFQPTFVPFGGSLDNFTAVLSGSDFISALKISITVTLLTVFFALLFAFLGALAVSRYKFKGRKSFILAVLVIQMLPAEGIFIAQFKMIDSLGLLYTVVGITLLYVAAVVPFTIWMLRGFVAGVPADLEEAAMVDGLSRTQAFFRITFPLLAPGLVAAGVYGFLQAWNEFTLAFIILDSPGKRTLPIWLRTFIQAGQARGTDWGMVMAASTLIAIPVVIFFLIVQGRMTSGLTAGAVKG